MMTRPRRDTQGASVIEYVLLLAMVVLVVVATLYALGRSPDRPASVLGDTFRNPPSGDRPAPVPDCPGPPNPTTTTSTLCRPTS
jgi:hypothetical protein